MLHPLVRGLVLALAVACTSSAMSQGEPVRLSVQDAVSLYARGEFDKALNDLDTRDLKLAPFMRELDRWIAAGDRAADPRRRSVGVAFALEVTWAATRTFVHARSLNSDAGNNITPSDAERIGIDRSDVPGRIASWAAKNLPSSGTSDTLDRTLWLATVGLAEDGHAWHRMLDDILPPARRRFPDEQHFRLADALARTNREIEPLRRGYWGNHRRHDALRNETIPAKGIDDAIKTFEPLLAEPALAGEVELRIGYLELRRDKWSNALTRFDAARTKTSEPLLRAAADYFAGWVYEQQNRPNDAIAAYRRAHAITPEMRNLSLRLSSLLFQRNERDEAYAILDRALNAPQMPMDLMLMLERADARFVPEWFASIRRALQ